MRPTDIQIIGAELAIKWSDGSECFLSLEQLRRACPCAGCKGEVDVMGQLHKGPDVELTADSVKLTGLASVGGYGIQPTWADGHATGIYSFDLLRSLSPKGT